MIVPDMVSEVSKAVNERKEKIEDRMKKASKGWKRMRDYMTWRKGMRKDELTGDDSTCQGVRGEDGGEGT